MAVRECHLIAKGSGGGENRGLEEGVDGQLGGLHGNVEGDIELGCMMACDQSNDDCNAQDKIGNDEEEESGGTSAAKSKQNDLDIRIAARKLLQDSETNTNENSKASLGVTGNQTNDASLESTIAMDNTSPRIDSPVSLNPESHNDSPLTVDVAVPTTVPPPPHPHHPSNSSSLYEMDDDPYDDDGDNKYSALRLHCTHSSNTSSNAAAATSPSAPPQSTTTSETRVVSATCAICIDQYVPGCYVSYSSNKECRHAFHRDCILMWLLKKEEPLCPCCRREFVLEELLNGGDGGGGDAVEGGDDDGVREIPALGLGFRETSATLAETDIVSESNLMEPPA